jgi:hypothetical protein
VVFGERHLRHVLLSYKDYYNATRTHLSLNKDAPVHRGVEWAGNVVCRPILGGLHHHASATACASRTGEPAARKMSARTLMRETLWVAPLPHHPACGSAPGGSRS